jgi:hypothetical protein
MASAKYPPGFIGPKEPYHKKHRPGFTKAQKLANAAWEAKYMSAKGMSDPDAFIRNLPKPEETESAKKAIEEAKKKAKIAAMNKILKDYKPPEDD